ncbi:MAG: adenylosuccinate synthase [Acidobacteria bacterium]|nr:adenylosuccinate synthase [Acidobacteriota bacterium]
MIVIGGQWGDEGKGKVVDLLSAGVAAAVRFNGGNNAGHTVKFEDRHFALHFIPSGIIHGHVRCYMGAWMVIDPVGVLREIDGLGEQGVDVIGRLALSERATVILPTHRALDGAREAARGAGSIGTTRRGIGPAYQDRAQRRALTTGLLRKPRTFAEHAVRVMEAHNRELGLLYGAEPVDLEAARLELEEAAERLAPLVAEVGPQILGHLSRREPVLFEGAQGVMLDLFQGTYPYVTSSSCLPGAAAVSCGIPVRALGPAVGVMKAYVTRVGGGPFPTELDGATGDHLRKRGNEFGTTTGRPRRCGWFDAAAARYAARVAGLDGIALTKLDVLDDLDEIRVAVRYRGPDGAEYVEPPADLDTLGSLEPVYETLPGWHAETVGTLDAAALPARARAYVEFLERQVGVPVVLVSTGPRREETFILGRSPLAQMLKTLMTGLDQPGQKS